MPAGGQMEKTLEAKTVEQMTAWGLFIALLEKVGVDWRQAITARVVCDPDGAVVEVISLARYADGTPMMAGEEFLENTDVYQFNRVTP